MLETEFGVAQIQTDCNVSPMNYGGPLIDIQGHVLGVLVPLSPEENTELAGAEWYDSGIGFAVPLEDVFAVLEKLKQGQDLSRGLMGVTLDSNKLFQPAVVATCQAGTPAAKAGLKKGDRIVEIAGQPIEIQSQLKHALGRRYAGEEVALVVLRDNQRVDVNVTLTDEITPYQLPFLGVLPARGGDDNAPPTVRYVFANSPAEKAGLKKDDVLLELDGEAMDDAASWRRRLAEQATGDSLQLTLLRNNERLTQAVVLGSQPEEIPQDLPPASESWDAAEGDEIPRGVISIKIPEEPNACLAYVPEDYDPRIAHGVVVWLSPPGDFDQQRMVERWRTRCEQYDLIVMAPQPADANRWQPTEHEFVRKALDDLLGNYTVDRNRIVAHGFQGGAALGMYFANQNREVVRGIAVVDAAIPLRLQTAANDPIERLFWYFSWSANSQLAPRIEEDIVRLRKFKFPVSTHQQPSPEYLDDAELEELARWTDTLDRL